MSYYIWIYRRIVFFIVLDSVIKREEVILIPGAQSEIAICHTTMIEYRVRYKPRPKNQKIQTTIQKFCLISPFLYFQTCSTPKARLTDLRINSGAQKLGCLISRPRNPLLKRDLCQEAAARHCFVDFRWGRFTVLRWDLGRGGRRGSNWKLCLVRIGGLGEDLMAWSERREMRFGDGEREAKTSRKYFRTQLGKRCDESDWIETNGLNKQFGGQSYNIVMNYR